MDSMHPDTHVYPAKDNSVADISTDDANTTTRKFDDDDLNTDASNGIQVSLLNDHIETEGNLTYKDGKRVGSLYFFKMLSVY